MTKIKIFGGYPYEQINGEFATRAQAKKFVKKALLIDSIIVVLYQLEMVGGKYME